MSKARDANKILREEGPDGLRRRVDKNRRPYVISAKPEALSSPARAVRRLEVGEVSGAKRRRANRQLNGAHAAPGSDNEDAIAEAFVNKHIDELRYCHDWEVAEMGW